MKDISIEEISKDSKFLSNKLFKDKDIEITNEINKTSTNKENEESNITFYVAEWDITVTKLLLIR